MITKNQQLQIFLLIAIITLIFTSCGSFSVDDPELKKQHESYLTLVEYHAFKQVLMYEYFGLFSNNFQNSNLFEYEPTQEECMAYFSKVEQLLAYEEKLVEAANLLNNSKGQVSNSDEYLLKSAMAKWDWLLKHVPFKGKNIELRNKIVKMSKDFTDEQRKYLFDLLYANSEWKGGALNEAQFFSKMESGELDNSILRIHNTFEEDGENGDYFSWAEQNKLLSAQLAYEYGKEGLETGEKVLVTTVENLNPAIGTSVKILDYGNKFLNYINKCTSGKTTDQFTNEVKQNIEEKYAESPFSSNETVNEKALSIVERAQRLANVAQVNKNPASVVSDVSGWGGIKITSEDQTLIPDVVFAERLYDEIGPSIVLATQILKNELAEWIIPLPVGDWDIVVVDNKGRSDTIIDYSTIGKYFGVANVSYNNNVVDEDENEDENEEEDNIDINLADYERVNAMLVYDPFSSQGFGKLSISNSCDDGLSPLSWNNNVFSTEFYCSDNKNESYSHHYKILGAIIKSNDGELMASGEFIHIRTIDYSGIGQVNLIQTNTITFDNIPFKAEVSNQLQFEIRINYNDEQSGMNILDYGGYSYVESGYRESSVVNEFNPLSSTRPTEYFYRISITLTNSDN